MGKKAKAGSPGSATKKVRREDFERFGHDVTQEALHLGLEVASLRELLIEKGVISRAEFSATREKMEADARAAVEALSIAEIDRAQ